MDLTDAYVRYLQDQADLLTQTNLLAALEGANASIEAELLRRFLQKGPGWTDALASDSILAGRRVYLGPRLPPERQAGDIWFDPLELVAMLLLPAAGPEPGERYAPEALARMQPFEGWMALRPVANWQYAAFLGMAKISTRQVQLAPPFRLLDMVRILHGKPTDPVTNLTCPEAMLFASWMGKGLSDQSAWQAAARLLPSDGFDRLWEPLRREWAGGFAEGVYAVVTPENFEQDWDALAADERFWSGEERMFFDEWQAPGGVGFRTHVLAQFGLLQSPWSDPGVMIDVQLLEVLKRT